MGQALEAHTIFWLEQQERNANGTAYAVERSAEAWRRAIARARAEADAATAASAVVTAQAVFAASEAGLSVRAIADELGLSKSDVARRLKPGHHAYSLDDITLAKIVDAWQ